MTWMPDVKFFSIKTKKNFEKIMQPNKTKNSNLKWDQKLCFFFWFQMKNKIFTIFIIITHTMIASSKQKIYV